MERKRKKLTDMRIRLFRLIVPVLGAAVIFAGCGMLDGGGSEEKVDFGQYGNEGDGQKNGSESGSEDAAGGDGQNSGENNDRENDSPDNAGNGGPDGAEDGGTDGAGDSQESDSASETMSEEQKKRMEEFHKSELAQELLSYLEENGRGDEAFSEPIFDSANRVYSREELNQLSDVMCRIFRNEIYARHGMIFGNEDLNRIYGAFSWYEGTIGLREFEDLKELPFNETENKNLSNVIAVEKARKKN